MPAAKTTTAKTTARKAPAAKPAAPKPEATTPAQDAEAALLKGVTDPAGANGKPAAAKAPAKTPAPKAAKAAKAPQTAEQKLMRPATGTVQDYVAWLRGQFSAENLAALDADPVRLMQITMTNYGAYRATKK